MQTTVGADPELFLKSIRTDELIASCGLIGGTKRNPKSLESDGFFVQEDNVALEFNIPPANTLLEWCNSIEWAINKLTYITNEKNLKLHISASEIFPPEQLVSDAAKEFGCEPDFCSWTGDRNPRPKADNLSLRSCGGHVHIGCDGNINPIMCAMDLFCGVPSVIMDTDTQRRNLYGKAGSFRKTSYGGEYRVLSNFWLKSKPLTEWVYTQTIRAVEFASDKSNWPRLRELEDKIVTSINFSHQQFANELIQTENLVLA